MPRALWRGSISFGLVMIPVSLFPARSPRSDLRFNLLHEADMKPVRNQRVDDSGHEVPWDEIVKGYEYAPDQYVIVSQDELDGVSVVGTQSVDILHFVDASEIDPDFYDTPYYTEPTKQGRKVYALLRETLSRTGKVGVARVVIRTRQRLCSVRADGDMLVINILRWPYQLRDATDFNLPGSDLDELGVTKAELNMAEQLVASMEQNWSPEEYTDTYRDAVLAMIEEKVSRGETTAVEDVDAAAPTPEAGAEVVNIMDLLKRSMEKRA